MININLLPEKLRKIERIRKVKVNIALFTGSAMAIGAVVVLIALFMIGRGVKQAAQIKARLRELAAPRDEAEALLKNRQRIAKELDLLDRFSDGRVFWSRRLNEISDAAPGDICLTKLSYAPQPATALLIKGEASAGQGNKDVVEFIDALRRAKDFMREFPQLNYFIESLEGGRKSFEVTCAKAKTEEKR